MPIINKNLNSHLNELDLGRFVRSRFLFAAEMRWINKHTHTHSLYDIVRDGKRAKDGKRALLYIYT